MGTFQAIFIRQLKAIDNSIKCQLKRQKCEQNMFMRIILIK